MTVLRDEGIAGLQQGVRFPSCSTLTVRKLGSNPIVEHAARMIEKYLGDALYVAIVPDSEDHIADFYSNELTAGPAADVTGWDSTGWGYLTWAQVEDYCKRHELVNTLRVFEFNRGEIY